MSFSLDTPSAASLKAEARLLRDERAATGIMLGHGAALEEVARRHGYRDWNTAVAALPERFVTPVQVGQRVRGTYMGKPFSGLVIGMQLTPPHFQVTVKFDQPVNVSKFESIVHNRQRVVTTVDVRGVSLSRTSDGEPHMRIERL
ncbi:MAG: hypothetical protein EON59_09905 [Alphaproteobacteria bacterium]|nr:MAG: hypothetical protein EON59_09905 [Alphaproteobacteria bacterium]